MEVPAGAAVIVDGPPWNQVAASAPRTRSRSFHTKCLDDVQQTTQGLVMEDEFAQVRSLALVSERRTGTVQIPDQLCDVAVDADLQSSAVPVSSQCQDMAEDDELFSGAEWDRCLAFVADVSPAWDEVPTDDRNSKIANWRVEMGNLNATSFGRFPVVTCCVMLLAVRRQLRFTKYEHCHHRTFQNIKRIPCDHGADMFKCNYRADSTN